MLSTILLPLVTIAGRIQDDFNCTYVVTSGALAGNVVYSPLATSCTDTLPTESCEILFKGSSEGPVVPDSVDSSRPVNCYSFQNGPIIENQKKMSIMSCPSYCGYCCQTKAFQCANPNPDNLDCHSITPQACMDPEQKPMLAKNCPAVFYFSDPNSGVIFRNAVSATIIRKALSRPMGRRQTQTHRMRTRATEVARRRTANTLRIRRRSEWRCYA
ncbi:hypothetical protein WR25_02319 isoform B [Diploscapter pachys]|uniref:ShKT domain-containing protein n=1 Tax=Diploscapter pachys TaxID=2018661 RepID=A0A2A2LCD2_9BILA|nr:hypothetical protein WR25_02319 isoform B [Diploscapter pachys]